MPDASVSIVVDPDFGGKLRSAAVSEPVWIAHSPRNGEEAERLWKAGVQGITTFVVSQPFDAEEAVAGILNQVLLHHPSVREVRVVGCSASASLRQRFAEVRFEVSENGNDGFVARSAAVA